MAAIVAVAVAVAGVAAFFKLRERPPDVERPEATAAREAAAPQEAARSTDAPASPPPFDSSATEPAESQPGPNASDAATPEPASCGIYSLSDIPSAPRRPSASAQWYEGASGFRRAGEEQASSGAPLLLFFHVDWCPHCRRFVNDVLPSAEMRDLGERIIKVKVNPEASGDDGALARQYSVTAFPTLLVIATPGQSPVRLAQWSSPRAFVESCERALPDSAREHLDKGISLSRSRNTEQAATELKAAAGSPKLAALALDHLGLLALGARCFSRAAAIYGRILDIDSTYEGGRGHHLRGFALFRSGDVPGALRDAEHACRLGYREGCTAADRIRPSVR